ncbi:MAG: histidine kinase, partial [Actinomycetales bacterium]
LVACHHYSGPLRVPFDARSAAEFLGQTASHLIDDRERADHHADERRSSALLGGITTSLAGDPRPVYDALYSDERLLSLVEAQGTALFADGQLLTLGEVPPASVLHDIAARVGAADGKATATNHLAGLSPDLAEWAHLAAGALHSGNGPDRWMLWLRPEIEKTVDWGGDPTNKLIAATEDPSVRLSPRKSFAKWRQVVRGQSLPWESWQLEVVENLRQHLSAELLRRTHEHTTLAESLQRTLVLDEAPSFDGLEVLARYRPAKGSQLGGDWWDAFSLPDGTVVMAVGDVAGHGVSAATAMAQIRTGLRAYMIDGQSPAACVDRLDVLTRTLLPGQTATVVVLTIAPDTGAVRLASAGHLPALLVRPEQAEVLPEAGRPLLGIGFGAARTDELVLDPGDTLVLYTDGLVERRGVELDVSIEQLRSAAGTTAGADLEGWVDALLTTVPGTLDDDLTIVALRPKGSRA